MIIINEIVLFASLISSRNILVLYYLYFLNYKRKHNNITLQLTVRYSFLFVIFRVLIGFSPLFQVFVK